MSRPAKQGLAGSDGTHAQQPIQPTIWGPLERSAESRLPSNLMCSEPELCSPPPHPGVQVLEAAQQLVDNELDVLLCNRRELLNQWDAHRIQVGRQQQLVDKELDVLLCKNMCAQESW